MPNAESGATEWMNLGPPPCNRAFLASPPPTVLYLLCSSHVGLLAVPQFCQAHPCLRPLHMLFPLSVERSSPDICLAPSSLP